MSRSKSNLMRAATVGDLTRIEIKSKLDAEFRRYSMEKLRCKTCQEFYDFIRSMHKVNNMAVSIYYTDPSHGDLLPINNDDNFLRAISTAKPLLRLFIQREGSGFPVNNLNKSKKNILRAMAPAAAARPKPLISIPQDFRRVSAIVDVDIIPETHRRVKLLKHNSDKPLGFYIRDGTSVRVTPNGVDRVPGIFISRLVPGGLAESTGLLGVNDEILEVNGIEVAGKTLDQVTDMMIANSENLIITVKPAIQLPPGPSWKKDTNRTHQSSLASSQSAHSLAPANSLAVSNGGAITLNSFTNDGFDDLIESDDDQPSIDENGVLSI